MGGRAPRRVGRVGDTGMIEWVFVLVLYMPSFCDTDVCVARRGVISVDIHAVDEAHCRRIRKTIARRLGAIEFSISDEAFAWAGEHGNPGGSASKCAERPPRADEEGV